MSNDSGPRATAQSVTEMNRRQVLKAAATTASGILASSALRSSPGPIAPQPAIDAYPGRTSYAPGEEVRLHVSSTASEYALEVARVGAERRTVLEKSKLKGTFHATPANASTHGCRWPVSTSFTIGSDWKSGYYSVKVRARQAGQLIEGDAFFVLRAAEPGREAKILLQLSTNTYNAYNDFGGSSLYAGGDLPLQGMRVSFERPLSPGFLSRPTDRELTRWHPYAGWHRWERPFVRWLEHAGYQVEYAANSDLEFRPEILKGYRLVLSLGHDEYWSSPMRDHLEKFIGDGGNVAFFSGNVAYWQVRSEDHGRAFVCYKFQTDRDPYLKSGPHSQLATLWSHRLVGRPENQMTGVSFCYGGYHRFRSAPVGAGAYTVYRPEHWVFEGTTVQWGDLLGAKDEIVGYECDGCELVFEDGQPVPTHRDGTPKTFEVLGTCPASLWPGDEQPHTRALFGENSKRRRRRGNAVMGVYKRGGTVFTTGCTEWSRGLEGGDPTVARITRNVLDRLSAT